tara:strand:+ start:33 stop:263 length:231 start_codon:yes stop_codon:yes gene_type:complete
MSDKKLYKFHRVEHSLTIDFPNPIEIKESRGYKKAVKWFQNKYPKAKKVMVFWNKDNKEIAKEQKLPMGRKKKLGG